MIDYEPYEHIRSVKYRHKIKQLVSSFGLERKTGITHFCLVMIFEDGKKYFLSNMPDWAIEYHKLGGGRGDEVFDITKMKGLTHFYPRLSHYDPVQNILVEKEENTYGYFDTYSIIRRSADCTFIALAVHNTSNIDCEDCFRRTRDVFEDFIVNFISSMYEEIKADNHSNAYLSILSNTSYLRSVVKMKTNHTAAKLTSRELDIMALLYSHYSVKLMAKNMNLSERTIRKYIEVAKEKLNVSSSKELAEIYAIHYKDRNNNIG